jgi:hypothetical protein
MLINLSNHPLSRWSPEQRQAAEREFGAIVDVPFPQIKPDDSLTSVREVVRCSVQDCLTLLQTTAHQTEREGIPQQRNAIHVMGEYTFTFLFVNEMQAKNIRCLASTTERIVTENPDGSKTTIFRFVQFRPYFD